MLWLQIKSVYYSDITLLRLLVGEVYNLKYLLLTGDRYRFTRNPRSSYWTNGVLVESQACRGRESKEEKEEEREGKLGGGKREVMSTFLKCMLA